MRTRSRLTLLFFLSTAMACASSGPEPPRYVVQATLPEGVSLVMNVMPQGDGGPFPFPGHDPAGDWLW